MLSSWKKLISSVFDYNFHANKCAESDKNFEEVVLQIYNELQEASRKSPSSQMNAIVGLSVLITELAYHQKVYGECEAITNFITDALQVVKNLTFDQAEYKLTWSHYSAEKGGKYAMSQLAKQVLFLVWAKFLVSLSVTFNDLTGLERMKKIVISKTKDIDDMSRLGAYGLGALSRKLDVVGVYCPESDHQARLFTIDRLSLSFVR